ncbi:hypothetical protein CEXT_493391 [Caerostris extrusa]|uniref:Uncharacterized protein n=1 Tax=Caerostris extrusa TaxID=172846 RepID=A0AAV4XSU9_CAEEX|nr:hypothetical protein CEXT_493391 [Caerostris extrusa]
MAPKPRTSNREEQADRTTTCFTKILALAALAEGLRPTKRCVRRTLERSNARSGIERDYQTSPFRIV